jgi:hypothetical protein
MRHGKQKIKRQKVEKNVKRIFIYSDKILKYDVVQLFVVESNMSVDVLVNLLQISKRFRK